MVMYTVASVQLINELSATSDVKQLWYVHNATGMGSFKGLRNCSNGYLPNAMKSTLLVRLEPYVEACKLFSGTNMSVTSEVVVVLGSSVGPPSCVQSMVSKRIHVSSQVT
uniref:Uncharacterized protein n=1 Tax=Amphimedon queenslandica TaxID=400682 RepID=A0A1X7T3A4_AMPQE